MCPPRTLWPALALTGCVGADSQMQLHLGHQHLVQHLAVLVCAMDKWSNIARAASVTLSHLHLQLSPDQREAVQTELISMNGVPPKSQHGQSC